MWPFGPIPYGQNGGTMTTGSGEARSVSAPIGVTEGRMFFDLDQLLSYAETNRDRYLRAKPFPHLVIDNFFPESVLDEAIRDFPSQADCTWREFKDSRHVKLLSQGDARLAPSIR